MSMSTPARNDLRAAVAPLVAIPCAIVSSTAPQSLTTKPAKPHSPRKMSRSVNAFALAGTPFERIEGGHERGDPRLDAGAERLEIDLAQRALGDLGGVVVAPGLRRAIPDEMFRAREDRRRIVETPPLIPADVGSREDRAEVGILTGALGDAAPSGVARNIHHRGKCPSDPLGRGLLGRHARGLLDERRIPGRGEAEVDGEDGSKPVDDVEAEQQRNVQPGALDRDALVVIDLLGARHVQEASDLARRDHCFVTVTVGARARGLPGRVLIELSDLLLERHLPEQLFDASVAAR